MKRNIFLRAALGMFILAYGASALLTGTPTFARYISSANGTAKARIAKFSVKTGHALEDGTFTSIVGPNLTGNAVEIAVTAGATETINWPIFGYIKEETTDNATDNGDTQGNDDSHVRSGYVAPGVRPAWPLASNGSAPENQESIIFVNESEVAVRVKVYYYCENIGIATTGSDGLLQATKTPLGISAYKAKNFTLNYDVMDSNFVDWDNISANTAEYSYGGVTYRHIATADLDIPASLPNTSLTDNSTAILGLNWIWFFASPNTNSNYGTLTKDQYDSLVGISARPRGDIKEHPPTGHINEHPPIMKVLVVCEQID